MEEKTTVSKNLSVSFSIKPFTSKEKNRIRTRFLAYFFISLAIVLGVFVGVFYIVSLFPDYINISTIEDLLKILIQTDGVLLGFVGIIYAQLLTSVMSNQDTLIKEAIEKPDKSINKAFIDFLDYRKNSLTMTAIGTFSLLLVSIFLSMLVIARNFQYQPTDTFATFGSLFGPFLFTIFAMVILVLTIVSLPTKPPLEEKK